MAFITAKRTLGFQIEPNPYVSATLTAADYNLAAYGVEYDVDIAVKDRQLVRGDFSHDTGVPGKRIGTVKFKIPLQRGSAAGVEPKWSKCMAACGAATTSAANGIKWYPHSGVTNKPATIEIPEKDEGTSPSMLVHKFVGCMGTWKLNAGSAGEPPEFEFDFKGRYAGCTDRAFGSILNPTGFDTTLPDCLLAVTTSLYGVTQKYNQITVDSGNAVELFTNPANAEGVEGAHIVNRDPVLDIDPDMQLLATDPMYTRHITPTRGALSLITQYFTVSALQAQVIQSGKPADREGHVTNKIRCRLTRDTNGDDEWSITQGTV